MLPTDFAIFSAPSSSIPLCIQTWASSSPRAQRVCSLFSWWGKSRSRPPPWMSKPGPSSSRHRRALDAPAAARSPGRPPLAVLARLVRLPEREVERVLLERGTLDALALVHLVGFAARECAVGLVAANAKVDVAARDIGVAGRDQRRNLRDDRLDPLAGERLVVGSAEPQSVGVLDVVGRHLVCERDARDAPRRRGDVDLVVHVRHVDRERDRVADVLEEALEEAEDDERSGVADMDPVIDGRPADIERNAPGLARRERPDRSRAGVVEAKLSHDRPRDAAWRSRGPRRPRRGRRSRSPRRCSPSR